MQETQTKPRRQSIALLVVDDSVVFRRFIGDIFEDCDDVTIVGEAQNGIEALDMVLKTEPDVIFLDVEMPLMDGMTALQHLMIHRPTPTIMFSSLTADGTARCFDMIKNGAIDFLCKDFIFQESKNASHRGMLLEKVRRAAQLKMRARDPVYPLNTGGGTQSEQEQRVIFCEECGYRVTITVESSRPPKMVTCSQCGDIIELHSDERDAYRRNTFITVLCGGEGAYHNLLEIIPRLENTMNGAVLVLLHKSIEQVNEFTEYLDAVSSMKVIRAREGITIEGGNCYVVSAQEYMSLKPYSAQLQLQRVPKAAIGAGANDILLASVSTIFKKRMAGVILSGRETDGDKGMAILLKNEGQGILLDSEECFCADMTDFIGGKCGIRKSYSSSQIVDAIKKLHKLAQGDVVAGW